jgi:hypothetical protein
VSTDVFSANVKQGIHLSSLRFRKIDIHIVNFDLCNMFRVLSLLLNISLHCTLGRPVDFLWLVLFSFFHVLKDHGLLLLLFACVKVRDNEDITASIEHLPSKTGTMKTLRETPEKPSSLIKKTAFNVQSNPVIAKESTIPIFDANETTTEEECGIVITVDMSSNASWSVTSDYVRKSCVLFATLSDKGGDFAEDAASNLDRLRNKTLSEVLCARLGTRLTKYGIHSNHFTAKFVRNNMERAVTIMKLYTLHKPERSLISAKDSESFFVPDMDCGEPFVHEEVNSAGNSRFRNIGA